MSSGHRRTVGVVQRLRALSEAECYARCYGWQREDSVKVTKAAIPSRDSVASGDRLRSLLEEKLDTRRLDTWEPEAA